jgi:site-specific DNA-methyltransferase (adenine-specific)
MLPEPYYDRDGITIYHADCRDVLPRLDWRLGDVVCTDPPYGTGGWRRMEPGRGDDPTASLIVEAWDDGAVDWLQSCHADAALVFWPAARTRHLLEAADKAGLTKHRGLYLRKPDPKPQVNNRIRWSVEPIWCLSRDGFVLYGGDDWHEASTPRANRDREATGHPYQKPLSALRWLLAKLPEGSRVIDPFAGSGTAIVAANALGIPAIGIEIEERYCEIAVKRLQQAVLPLHFGQAAD